MTALWCVLACAAGVAVIGVLVYSWSHEDEDKAASMPKGSYEARQPHWEVRSDAP